LRALDDNGGLADAPIKSAPEHAEGAGMTNRREFLKGTLALSFSAGELPLAAERAGAQAAWPARTIAIVVPFPPGGTADFAARPLAAHLSDTFGKNVVVENKGGAGGGIGHAYVARAEPDGYTIMTALPSLAVIPEANRLAGKPVTYEMDQFVPLARMFADPPILAVKASSPWSSLGDFIAAVKNNPAQIAYGTSGHLGTVHLAMEMFLNAAQLKMVHVPYQGRPGIQRAVVEPGAGRSDLGVHCQGAHRCRQHPRPGAMGHQKAAELPARADFPGGGISRRDLHPLDRRVCAEQDTRARDTHPARCDPPLHAGPDGDQPFHQGGKPSLLPGWTGLRAVSGLRHGSLAQGGAQDRPVII
jgi:Tripartite tricarboxylate transporter family receptor